MNVREAVETDTEHLAELADMPTEAARALVHDRTVRVAERAGGGAENAEETAEVADDADDAESANGDAGDADVAGFVCFDARPGVVHVTRLCGDRRTMAALLDEPASFATAEDMAVEILVPESDDETAAVVASESFEDVGVGPRFDGEPTRRYRREP